MEACGGAHFLGRALREQGHEVRLIPAQYVKPYVKTNKSDYIRRLGLHATVAVAPRLLARGFAAVRGHWSIGYSTLMRKR